MILNKRDSRLRRARRARCRIRDLQVIRLSFHKTNQHLYAQLVKPQTMADGGNRCDNVLSTISTVGKNAPITGKNTGAAQALGKAVAAKAKDLGITRVAFDRGGNKYHGRVKAFADAARESGLEF